MSAGRWRVWALRAALVEVATNDASTRWYLVARREDAFVPEPALPDGTAHLRRVLLSWPAGLEARNGGWTMPRHRVAVVGP